MSRAKSPSADATATTHSVKTSDGRISRARDPNSDLALAAPIAMQQSKALSIEKW